MAISVITSAKSYNTTINPTITHGMTISSGDVLIATVTHGGGGNSCTDNNGSYPFTETMTLSTGNEEAAIYCRVAGASEPSSYTWTFDWAGGHGVLLRQFRGVHDDIYDVTPSTSIDATGSSTACEAPTINAAADACGVVIFLSSESGGGGGTNAEFSSLTNSFTGLIETETWGHKTGMAYKTGLSSGAVGATAVTLAVTANWAAVQFTLKVAGTAPTVTTTAISAITATTATGGGTVTAEGSSAVTDYGVCWNTTGTPTITDSHTHDKPA